MLELWFLGKWASMLKTKAKYSVFWFSTGKWFFSWIFKLNIWSARQASPCHNPEKLGVNKRVWLAVMGKAAFIWLVMLHTKNEWLRQVREEKPKISFFELSFRKKIKRCHQKYPLFGQIFLKIRKVPESKKS